MMYRWKHVLFFMVLYKIHNIIYYIHSTTALTTLPDNIPQQEQQAWPAESHNHLIGLLFAKFSPFLPILLFTPSLGQFLCDVEYHQWSCWIWMNNLRIIKISEASLWLLTSQLHQPSLPLPWEHQSQQEQEGTVYIRLKVILLCLSVVIHSDVGSFS